MIEEKNVNLIFAVTENKFKAYSQLNNVIPGSETGRLAGDSHNIVDLVRDNCGVIIHLGFFILKGLSESVYRRRTENTMAKRKSIKGQTTIYKTYI
jgi:hypothetical protein